MNLCLSTQVSQVDGVNPKLQLAQSIPKSEKTVFWMSMVHFYRLMLAVA